MLFQLVLIVRNPHRPLHNCNCGMKLDEAFKSILETIMANSVEYGF